MYIRVYAYAYKCVYIYIFTYIYIYQNICIHTRMSICIYTHICMHTYMRICVYPHTHKCKDLYIAEAKEEAKVLEDKGGKTKKNDKADVGVSLCYIVQCNLEEIYIYMSVCVYILGSGKSSSKSGRGTRWGTQNRRQGRCGRVLVLHLAMHYLEARLTL